MDTVAFIVSLIALALSIVSIRRTGGLTDLRRQMDLLSSKTEDATKGAREVTADALSRLESLIRGQDTAAKEKPSAQDNPPKGPQS